uniref:Putative chromatin-remodeling complex ATPase chain n=1 Tax=Lygus hesperus TaxID=30085 RepID=A0A0A9XCT6_LYGHE
MDRVHRIGQKKQVNVFRFIIEGSIEEKIVERATKKLAFDTIVIQRGRHLNTSSASTTDELLGMLRFGAMYIFQSHDSTTITDDDIDAILQRGQEKTALENQKLQEFTTNLHNFSFHSNENDTQFNTLTFEGINYTDIRNKNLHDKELISLLCPPSARGDRITRTSGDAVNDTGMYGSSNHSDGGTDDGAGIGGFKKYLGKVREYHPSQRFDFQFLYVPRIHELERKRWDADQKLLQLRVQYAEDYIRTTLQIPDDEAIDRNGRLNVSNLPQQVIQDFTVNGLLSKYGKIRYHRYNLHDDNTTIDTALETKLRTLANCCTDDEDAELHALLNQGFPQWRRIDLQHFISRCTEFGRNNIQAICDAFPHIDPETVRRYHTTFFAKYTTLREHDRYIKQIETGEQILQKKQKIQNLILQKVQQCVDPLHQLHLPYTTAQTTYTPTNDRFLLLSILVCGYGNWNAILSQFLQSPYFHHDFFIRTRTPQDIARRAEYLLRILNTESHPALRKRR